MGNGVMVDRDNEGYLINPEQWDEAVAGLLAQEEGITLETDHWPILHFMRAYWLDHRIAPDVRHVLTHLNKELGLDKKGAKELLFRLFPYGYVQQACKVAGMMRPRAWSTG